MELTLNLVWVCVAIAGILVQIVMLSRAAAPLGRQESNWRKIVAMGCALVILFFVISMTDDLHDQALLLEEKKLSRLAPGTRTSVHPSSDRSIAIDLLLFFPPVAFSPPLPAARRLVEPSDLLFALAVVCESFCGRAPPAFLT